MKQSNVQWRHMAAPLLCPLFLPHSCCCCCCCCLFAIGFWSAGCGLLSVAALKADNKYLQETMSPLISAKKLSTRVELPGKGVGRTHKTPARKQFIKVLLLNCRLCGVRSESFVCPAPARVGGGMQGRWEGEQTRACAQACWFAWPCANDKCGENIFEYLAQLQPQQRRSNHRFCLCYSSQDIFHIINTQVREERGAG